MVCGFGRIRRRSGLIPNMKHAIGRVLIPLLPVNRRTFDILRFEWGCIYQRLRNACSPSYHRKISELRRLNNLSVNFGSGGYGLPGWINIDARASHKDTYIAYDMRRPLPFKTGSVKRIFAEHVVEHIDFRDDIPSVFTEFHRVLQPGGTVRIIVPDTERFLSAYVHRSEIEFSNLDWNIKSLPSDIYTPMHIINHIFHQGGEHMFAWDFETMEFALNRAGFSIVKKQSFRVSDDPELAIDRQQHASYSLVVEATK
jgi:predicted SAM-dependent methyltransferase